MYGNLINKLGKQYCRHGNQLCLSGFFLKGARETCVDLPIIFERYIFEISDLVYELR